MVDTKPIDTEDLPDYDNIDLIVDDVAAPTINAPVANDASSPPASTTGQYTTTTVA